MIHKKAKNGMVDSFDVEFSELQVSPTSRHNGRRRVWVLTKPFKVTIHHAGGSDKVYVPAGFETDFATIPLICQVFLGGRDDYTEESICHDWFCVNRMPRFWANAQMRVLMTALGRPKWKTLAVYYALMLFGYRSPTSRLFNLFTRKRSR